MLESQLTRLKAQLAANAGNEELMQFFFSGQLDDVAYIDGLKNRVLYVLTRIALHGGLTSQRVAEQRAAAVNQTLSIFQDDHPNVVQHMEAEADALQKLAAANAKVEAYEKMFGNSSPPDVAQLTEKIRVQEGEITKLRLLNEQHAKVRVADRSLCVGY